MSASATSARSRVVLGEPGTRERAATRTSYDETLARLIGIAGGASPVAGLTPDDFAAVMDRWDGAGVRDLEFAPVGAHLLRGLGAAPRGTGNQPGPPAGAAQARPPRRPLHPARPPGQAAGSTPHGIGWTLHQLRHSALQHLAAAGRTAAELRAKSRHAHLASLGAYVRLGEHTSARVTADAARPRAR